ncbi:MAG: PD-(D/E)XK nuclease family protein [Elusimicrobiota bacterium]
MKEVELNSISASKLRLYILCPRRYYYSYGEGVVQEETRAMLFGTYVHAVLESYIKELLKSGLKQDLTALLRIASSNKEHFDAIEETGNLSFFEADILLNRFASQKIDPEKIYGVEKFFRIPLSENESVPIVGRIDRIDLEIGPDDEHLLHIIDYKTGRNELTESELKKDIQMKFYVLASYYLYRRRYTRFRFTLYYLTDNSKVSVSTYFDHGFLKEINSYIDIIKNDTEFKKKPAQHCKNCPAFKDCRPELEEK